MEVFQQIAGRIAAWREAVSAFVDTHGVLAQVAAAIVAILVALVLFKIAQFLIGRIERRVERRQGARIRALRFQQQEILSAAQSTRIVVTVVRWLCYAVFAFLLYWYVQIVLGFFPATQAIAADLLTYFVTAITAVLKAVINYFPNLGFLVLILLGTVYAIKLARLIFKGIEEGRVVFPGFYKEWSAPTLSIVRLLLIVFAIVLAFPYLPGSQSPAFRAVSIFLGVLFSLGSTGAVANAVSGIVLTYMRAFNIGDRVKIADAVGDVVEKTTFVTRVRSIKNVDITIPNAMVLSNHIINFSAQAQEAGLILHTTVTIGYDVPWRGVHALLIDAALATEGIETEPRPFVLQTGLEDYYVKYELNASTRNPGAMAQIYGTLHQSIQDKFNEAGIEIASPAITGLRDANAAQMPDDYLPKDYRPGGFRIRPLQRPGDGEREEK